MKDYNSGYNIYICGISKNCIENIEENLRFLEDFSKNTTYSSKIIIVDSDSNDGTKDVIEKYRNKD